MGNFLWETSQYFYMVLLQKEIRFFNTIMLMQKKFHLQRKEVLRNGELGILVEPKNSESIADGINSLLENPESSQTFIYKAYDFCLRELSIDRMMGQTISVYEDVIRARA